jgi:NADH dehydrogenase [ubiquinone] 1 alpha subcomplex assembly factor 6
MLCIYILGLDKKEKKQFRYVNMHVAMIKSVEADHCASHIAKASFICKVIRGIKYHASNRQCFIPLSVCAEQKLSQESVYTLRSSEELSDAVLNLASQV